MIEIKSLAELDDAEQVIRQILNGSAKFPFMFENIYAFHLSEKNAVTFVDEKECMIATFKPRKETAFECCTELEPVFGANNAFKIKQFLTYVLSELKTQVLYFPLVYENSNFFELISKDDEFVCYKRLYTSICKPKELKVNILHNQYFSEYKKRKFEKDLEIKVITNQNVKDILFEIEKNSWKNLYGRDMTSQQSSLDYYNHLVESGIANVSVVFDKKLEKPVAYRLDIVQNKKLYQLKTSFNEEYKKYKPGIYLTLYDLVNQPVVDEIDLYGGPNLIKEVIETGRVERYDFCFGDKDEAELIKKNRVNWDLKNWNNFENGKAIREVYNKGVKKMTKSKVMFVRVSNKCNSGCFMCRYANNQGTFNISTEQFENLLKIMKEEGGYKVVRFTGGEPLLHPDLPLFLKRCKEEGFLTSIITNGYLMPNKYKEVVEAGLDQVIFSLDGSVADIHDKARNLPGCYNNIVSSIKAIKTEYPNVIVRVNTVASKYNVKDMKNLLDLLVENNVDMWSIIPIRTSKDLWSDGHEEEYIAAYKEFVEYAKKFEKPKFIGYSMLWGGRDENEIHQLFIENKFYRPQGKCKLVEHVRFYVPDYEEIVPCNCASHRIEQIQVDLDSKESMLERTELMKNWLAENGPETCRGCEPANVYVSNNPDCLEDDIFLI